MAGPTTLKPAWCKAMSAVLLCIAVSVVGAQTTAAQPPLSAFFDDPRIGNALLSPDGRSVAMTVRGADGGRARLAVLDLETMKSTIVAAFDDGDVQLKRWVNNQRLVFDGSVRLTGPGVVDTGHGLYAVNRDGSQFRQLVEARASNWHVPRQGTPPMHWSTRLLDDAPEIGGDDVLVISPLEISRDKVDHFTLHRLNTRTGKAQELDVPKAARDFVVDRDGEPRLAMVVRMPRVEVHHRGPKDDAWRVLTSFDLFSEQSIRPRFVAPDGALYATAGHDGRRALFKIDPATGRRDANPLLASPDFDLSPEFIADRERLLGLRFVTDGESTHWLAPELADLQRRIDAKLPGTVNRLQVPLDGGSPWVLVQRHSDRSPMQALLYHRERDALTRLGQERPAIDPQAMGSTTLQWIKARDGLRLPVWVTMPSGARAGDGTARPAIVLLHGGPWIRGRQWAWDAEAQFLATRGYVVIEPEFRGSTGYGAAHFEAGFRQYGRAMQDDVTDATRWAVAQKLADPARICLMGASYGGYATLMGLVREPELYRCGVQWVGVTDPKLLFTLPWGDITNEAKTHSLPTLIGDPDAGPAFWSEITPLARAERIRAPLLMAYGAWDLRVPIVHGERLRDAMKSAGLQPEWVAYDNEGHGWHRAENRLDFWKRVEVFLARHLGAR